MFLRTLTLKGFKSFAESTVLEFQPGLNVVVGPNGSGKSNIVDAVAWVLGAQGPRAVRSAKMDDVIFAGTARKTALGRAEVSLTIDNSDGVLPIDLSEVTITRTLFRSSGESEYALNGVTCRLLDVQELLSDSGVGRQQHVIVSQGNLDAILDARPEDRRLIIEEAAGILKFRRRKEKAERRLEGTEANLVRLTDLLREVGRQLRPLERQADAARRHGSLVVELDRLRLHLRGRELAALDARARTAAAGRDKLAGEEAGVRAVLADLDSQVADAEAAMVTAGGSSLGDALGRLEALRERARGLAAVIAERSRSAERDLASAPDLALVAKLRADANTLGAEIEAVDAEVAALAEPARLLAEAEAALASERLIRPESEAVVTRAAEARGELVARRTALERTGAEVARLEERVAVLEADLTRIDAENRVPEGELEQVSAAEAEWITALDAASGAQAAAADAHRDAEVRFREASDEHRRWTARAEALAEAAGRSEPSGPTSTPSLPAGVLGALVELVDIEPGHEAALEAALSGALDTLVVENPSAAEALLNLKGGRRPENLLLLSAFGASGSSAGALPPGSRSLGAVVTSTHPGLSRALDSLLGTVVLAADIDEAIALVAAHPESTVVTPGGARLSASEWRVGAGRAGETLAALAVARESADAAGAARSGAERALADAAGELRGHDSEVAKARTELASVQARRTSLEATFALVSAERERMEAELAGTRAAIERYRLAWSDDDARVAELAEILPGLEAEEAESARRAAAAAAVRLRQDEQAAELAGRRADFEARNAELDERRRQLDRRSAQIHDHLAQLASDADSGERRRAGVERLLVNLGSLSVVLGRRQEGIDAHLEEMRARRDRHAAAVSGGARRLEALRGHRHEQERRLEEVRERLRRVELDDAEVRMRREAAVEALRRELDTEPEVALATECPALPAGNSPTSRVRELERELRLMGQVNPLALEELTALQERHAFLTAQLDDVKGSRRELARVIRAVEAEMTVLLAAAYADVAENFSALFETLFPGGKGRLQLTDPEHVLESGIEVDARPAGKNVRKLSLLSGGERSLVALAFLFAVFRSRPSPFYLLDEVEAALDDLNLHRFVDLLDEFRAEAQLLVVTHQKRTMEAADCLYGVTMQPGGSSRVLSERVRTTA